MLKTFIAVLALIGAVSASDSDHLFEDAYVAYDQLGDNAKAAVRAAQLRLYDPSTYVWGQTVPTYSFAADPLARDCLGGFEIYSSSNCDLGGGSILNSNNWRAIADTLNAGSRNSTQCEVNFDILGNGQYSFDHQVSCNNQSISLILYTANS